MNDHLDLERIVAGTIADESLPTLSEAFYDELFVRAGGAGPRPEWLALLRQKPMRSNARLAVGSPTLRVAAVLAATFLLAVAVAGFGVAGQRLLGTDAAIIVAQDGSGDYASISEAVDAAGDGDEIIVRPGTYEGSIVIDKDVTLLGEDRDSVIIESSVGCTVDPDTDSQICPEGTPMVQQGDQLGLYREADPLGLVTEDVPFAIQLVDSEAEVGRLTIHDQLGNLGIVVFGGAPVLHDIALAQPDGSGRAEIRADSAAIVRDSELGSLWIFEASPVTVIGSAIADIRVNLANSESEGGEAIIRESTIGSVSIAGPVTLEGNVIAGSMASDDRPVGIDVQRGGGWVIRDNVIREHQTGIRVEIHATPDYDPATRDGLLEGNLIEGNGVGLFHDGAPPRMTGNRICDNTIRNVRGDRSDTDIDATANEICPDDAA